MGLHQLIAEFEVVIKLGDALFNLVEIEVNVLLMESTTCTISSAKLDGPWPDTSAARTVLIALDGVLHVEINAP